MSINHVVHPWLTQWLTLISPSPTPPYLVHPKVYATCSVIPQPNTMAAKEVRELGTKSLFYLTVIANTRARELVFLQV